MAASVIITDNSDILGHGWGGEGGIRVVGTDHSNIIIIASLNGTCTLISSYTKLALRDKKNSVF